MQKLCFLLAAICLSGCSHSIYFATHTRVGIDASTDGAGIGGKTAAIAYAPPKKDGSAFDILGYSDIDASYKDTVMDEEFAIGAAAVCAASTAAKMEVLQAAAEEKASPLIFGSYSSFSLVELSWGNSVSTGITFGYKRGAGIRMPIGKDDKIGDAYARVTVNTTDTDRDNALKSNLGGIRYMHTFATGKAAVLKARARADELTGSNQGTGDSCEKNVAK